MNNEQLKELIDSKIKTNGQQSINGATLNEVLKAIVDSLDQSFVATYDETTWQEIATAYFANGRIVYCKKGNALYHLVHYQAQYAIFVSVVNADSTPQGSWVSCNKFGHWDEGTFTL